MSTSILDKKVTLQFALPFADVTQIEYAPPPFDVVGVNGAAAEGFVEPL